MFFRCIKIVIWIIVDNLFGKGRHKFDGYFHFAEGATARKVKNEIVVSKNNVSCRISSLVFHSSKTRAGRAEVRLRKGWFSGNLGKKIPAPLALFSAEEQVPLAFVHLVYPHKGDNNELISEQLFANPETGALQGRIDFKAFSDDIEISNLNELQFERRLKRQKKNKAYSNLHFKTLS